jgi:hypothetical protein
MLKPKQFSFWFGGSCTFLVSLLIMLNVAWEKIQTMNLIASTYSIQYHTTEREAHFVKPEERYEMPNW